MSDKGPKSRWPEIAVIGGGIGGLSAAIALKQRGFRAKVYEQAAQLGEIGAGLTINASAALAIADFGLKEPFEALDPPSISMAARDARTGEVRNHVDIDFASNLAEFGALSRLVHRADLHDLLAGAAGDDIIVTGRKLVAIAQDADGVDLVFADGARARADIVVGCDGVKSVVRETLFDPAPAQFTGFVAWRGLVDRARVGVDLYPGFVNYADDRRMFARYPVRHGSLINYVAIARKDGFTSESWNYPADVSEVLAEFSGWYEEVTAIIAATEPDACKCWALYTREPLARYVDGRVVLAGDAAHPMTPFYGMGAALAIEDGLILARAFAAADGEWREAFARYEAARVPRGNLLQRMSLEKAEAYMNRSPEKRAQSPVDGLGTHRKYDPATVAI